MTATVVPFPTSPKPLSRDEAPNLPRSSVFALDEEKLVRLGSHRTSVQVVAIRDAAIKMGWHVPNDPRRAAEVIAGKLVEFALVIERANAVRAERSRRVSRGRPR